MQPTFLNKANSSVYLWLDNLLCQEGSGHFPSSSNFYKLKQQFNNLYTYSSPYSQFVYDVSISGANVISGIYLNGNYVTTGTSGFYGINYSKGQAYFTSELPSSTSISGNFTIKDFNVVLTNESESKILFETKYSPRYKSISNPTGLLDNQTTYPVIFIKNNSYNNEPFAFGGEVSTKVGYSFIIFSDDKFKLDSTTSLICDQVHSYIPIFNPQEMPFDIYGRCKSGVFNYKDIRSTKNPGTSDSLFIEKVGQIEFSQKLYGEMNNLNPEVYMGIIDVDLSSQRTIR